MKENITLEGLKKDFESRCLVSGDNEVLLKREIECYMFIFSFEPGGMPFAGSRYISVPGFNERFSEYSQAFMCTEGVCNYVEEKSRSLMQPNLSVVDLKKLPIPLPSIEIQAEIVAKIEVEQSIINSNKHLIQIFEQRIKDRIAKVWGE